MARFQNYATSLALTIVACSSTANEAQQELGGVKTVTVAELHPDAPPTVHTYTGDRSSGGLSFEGEMGALCSTGTNLYFDELVGTAANELCVSGTGSASLSSLVNGGTFGKVKSFTPQAYDGYFSDGPPGVNDECATFVESSTQENVGETGTITEITQGTDTCVQLMCSAGSFLCTIDCRGYQKQACYSNSVGGSNHDLYCQEHLECP